LAPVVFAPLQAIAWLLWSWFHPAETTGLAGALALAAYGLLFGYLYATISTFAFLGAIRFGVVTRYPAAE
jgi:hypothetical protein